MFSNYRKYASQKNAHPNASSHDSLRAEEKGEIRHAPVSRSNIPLVEIDDNDIFISSIQVSYSVSLILYNNQGNIIYECMSNSSSSCLKIDIPSEIIEEAFSVQITSNGTDYIGEIY